MKTAKWSQEQLADIAALQEQHSLTRKSAVQRFRRNLKKSAAAPASMTPALDAVKADAATRRSVRVKIFTPEPAKAVAKKSGKPETAARKTWATEHMQKCVALYAKGTGMSVPDIAEKMGDRNKQNRIRQALTLAGVYQK